jgi:hypothetical protein
MKKSFTLLLLSITFLTAAQAQIPNSSFENWTTTGSYSTPDGWDNFNSLTAPNSVYTCEKGTTGAPHGSSFLMLTTKVVGSSTVPGLVQSGVYDIATKKPKYGFAFTGRPLNLTGKFQYMTNGTDTGRIAGYLSAWNPVSHTRDLVADFTFDFAGTVTSWTSFSISLTYESGETPDTAVIGIVSSNTTTTAGTYLYVDSLNFTGSAAGVPMAIPSKYNITLLPNPATDKLSIDLGIAATDDVKLQLTDMFGRVVTERTWHSGNRVYSMSLNTIPPGLYFVKLKLGDDIQTQQLVIQ